MKSKKILTSTALATAVAAGSYFLGNKENREKIMMNWNRLISKIKKQTKEDHDAYFQEKLGHSDPEDIPDNKMVGEGSTYAVEHYNKKQHQ